MYLFQYKSQLDLPGHSMKLVVMLITREAVVGLHATMYSTGTTEIICECLKLLRMYQRESCTAAYQGK